MQVEICQYRNTRRGARHNVARLYRDSAGFTSHNVVVLSEAAVSEASRGSRRIPTESTEPLIAHSSIYFPNPTRSTNSSTSSSVPPITVIDTAYPCAKKTRVDCRITRVPTSL